MNKLIMCGIIFATVLLTRGVSATEDGVESELRSLLGDNYYELSKIEPPTTPVSKRRTTDVSSILSPVSKRAICENQKQSHEFEKTKAELEATKQQLSERDERITQLEMQIFESLSTIADLVNKNQELQGKITDKNAKLACLKDVVDSLQKQANILARQVADFETTTELDD